jgi:hypothetical protein
MTKQDTAATLDEVIQATDEWLMTDPESNILSLPREIVAIAFNGPRRQTVISKQETWDGCADMRFSDLLTHVTNEKIMAGSGNGTSTFERLFNHLVGIAVRQALTNAADKLDGRSREITRHPLLDDKTIEERAAHWRGRLLSAHGAMPLSKVIMLEPNRWGFYLYRPQGDKVVGDIYETSGAERIENLSLPLPKGAQAILEFHPETSPDMKAVEGIDFDIHYLRASVANEGVLIAHLDGYLLSWPKAIEHLEDGDFLDACDCTSQELAEFAYYMLVDHGSAKEIFSQEAVFYLHHWEVAKEWRGCRIGAELMRKTLEAVRRFEPTTRTVAVDLSPLQYFYPLPPLTPSEIRHDYEMGCRSLRTYWDHVFPDGRDLRTLRFNVKRELNNDDLSVAIASLNGRHDHLVS